MPDRHAHQRPQSASLPLSRLDTLWVQLTGTLCNLSCTHCFISCSPDNTNHPMMSRNEVERAVESALDHGLKEVYFTGGEPMMHPDFMEICRWVLERAPLSVLTNGLLVNRDVAHQLGELFRQARYNFDLRVSLDGTTQELNDPLRGAGTFRRIIRSIRYLADEGVNPVLTVTDVTGEQDYAGFQALLLECGVRAPRVKFLPPVRIGREAERAGGYRAGTHVSAEEVQGEDLSILQCSSCRLVGAKGWYPCPILLEEPNAQMGEQIDDALRPIQLSHPACSTCWYDGLSCRT